MQAPSPRYIITRAAFLIALIVALLFGYGVFKKKQRKDAIVAELRTLTGDSGFFRQFYAEDARKSLVKAVGLIAEANSLGMDPDETINLGMGIEAKFFENELEREDPPARERIIRQTLRSNYDNFLKLGYRTDFHTLTALKKGELPPIPAGPQAGRRPELHTLIPAEISPGIEKVLANLEIRPPQQEPQKPTDIQLAAAKQLARDLAEAQLIEEPVRDKIIAGLAPPATPDAPKP
jgi:hypothetical protein